MTAARLREVVTRIIEAGHWHDGDPDILVVLDSGYDLTRLAWLLKDLPVEIMGRLRSDRVMYFPAPARQPGANGRPVRHGAAFKLADERSWPAPAVTAVTGTTRYGTARVAAWGRLHQRLASRAGWEHHDGELPVIEGTLIRLHVDHLPGNRSPEPLWLWSSRAGTSAAEVTRTWQEFLRRFDIEHTFRFFKQVLGWTRPKLRDPAAADRWTWLILACLTDHPWGGTPRPASLPHCACLTGKPPGSGTFATSAWLGGGRVARGLVVGDLRVQVLERAGGRRSFTIVWPEGAVHEAADAFLRTHDGSGTQRTYAFLLVDHLRWLEREALTVDGAGCGAAPE